MRVFWILAVALVAASCSGTSSGFEPTAEIAVSEATSSEATSSEEGQLDQSQVDESAPEESQAEEIQPAAPPVEDSNAEPASEDPAPVEDTAAEDITTTESVGDGLFPTVVGAQATSSGGGTWRVDVTLSSEYDSPERYADAWRVLDGDDNELGVRILTHDHASEQPFTRSHSVDIPTEIDTVFIEGRDQVNGWSGERFELALDR